MTTIIVSGDLLMSILSVSGVAKLIASETGHMVRPRDITLLFYNGELRDDLCPIVGGRRVIPESYVAQIETALRRSGKLRKRRQYA